MKDFYAYLKHFKRQFDKISFFFFLFSRNKNEIISEFSQKY